MSFDFTEEEKKMLLATTNYRACSICAREGNLEGLKFLEEIGFRLGYSTLMSAVSAGQLEVVKWLVEERDFDFDIDTMVRAVEVGELEVVKFLASKDCPWNSRVIFTGVRCNHVANVDWLIRNDCPLGRLQPMTEAACQGNKDMVTCLRSLGIEWNEYVYQCAADRNHHELCEWMKENGCPTEYKS